MLVPPRADRRGFVLAFGLLFVAGFLCGQEPDKPVPPPSAAIKIADEPRAIDPASLLPAPLAAPVTIEFNEASLSDVVKWLQTERKLGVIVEQAALAQEGVLASEPITDKLVKAPLYLLLDRLRTARIGWYAEEGVLHLTTLEIAAEKTRTIPYNVGDLFDAKYDTDGLIQAVTQSISPSAWNEVGGVGSIDVLGDVLFVSQSDELHLQVKGLLAALRKPGRRTYINDPPEHAQLRAALARPVSVDFHDVPLATAVEKLAKQAEVDLRLDRLSLQKINLRDRQPVSLTLADQKLNVVLQALFDKLKLTWVIRDGVIWIRAADGDPVELKTAVYDVRDLCLDAGEANALENAVQSQLTADQWSTAGGAGTLEFPVPGTMVVRQTEPIHDRLVELLENYRAALRISKPRTKPGSDPKEVLTRYYRMPAAMAADAEKALPLLIKPDTWRGPGKTEAVGTIFLLASKPQLETVPNSKPEATTGILTQYAVLVIKQTREVHDELPKVLAKIEAGDNNGQPFVTSVVPFGKGGGGGFGGGFFAVPSK